MLLRRYHNTEKVAEHNTVKAMETSQEVSIDDKKPVRRKATRKDKQEIKDDSFNR